MSDGRAGLFPVAGLRGLVGELQQTADAACDGILGDGRVGETSEFLKARIPVLKAQLARGTKVFGDVVAENLECAAHFLAGFGSGLRAAAHVGVVEVRQTVRLAPCLAVGALACPLPC